MYCLLPLWLSIAHADPIADLAPGPRELNEVQAELEARLLESEAIERAVARLQSAFSGTPPIDETCRDPLRGPYAMRLRLFAEAWHDTAQRVRVQADRVERTALAPTVVPIIDPDRRAQLDSLLSRSKAQESGWLELLAWVSAQKPEACGEIDVTTMPGLSDPIIRGTGEKPNPVAVLAITPGFVCAEGSKEGVPSDGRVMIVTGPTCWSDQRWCPCDPKPHQPGAILGP